MILEYIKTENDTYLTLREVLSAKFHISERLRIKLKKNNKIFINNLNSYVDTKLNLGDVIRIEIDFEEETSNIVPTKMDLDIIYEDDAVLVINKPAGLPVHPSALYYDQTLSNGVRYYFDSINLHKKIRPVNRLDKNTSGLVVFAKNEYVQECLVKQMQNKLFNKQYIAICVGLLDKDFGTIDAPIARKSTSIIERCVDPSGDKSITHYSVLKKFKIDGNDYSELLINLETGRTHQIRVHMAYIGHPLLGDSLYGTSSPLIDRQALHAYKIEFLDVITNQKKSFTAPISNDIKFLLKE